MPPIVVNELVDAGVHFGHRASRWNPKMRPYIYGKRNLIHIIDLRETVRSLLRATRYLSRVASQGSLILFVGTKRQAAETIEREATRCGMPYVNERWLGGTLTNFRTIRSRLQRLEELETQLDTEQAQTYSKKMLSTLSRERRKIARNLSGIREMNRLPEALVVVDPRREHIAVREAKKLGIRVVALLDTDCDPDEVDLPIPGNDDSIRSIELVLARLADAVVEGRASLPREEQERLAAPPRPAAPRPGGEPVPAASAAPPKTAGMGHGDVPPVSDAPTHPHVPTSGVPESGPDAPVETGAIEFGGHPSPAVNPEGQSAGHPSPPVNPQSPPIEP